MIGCEAHPQSEAVGICMSCKRRICFECVTRVDGINRCTSCLTEMSTLRPPASQAATKGRGGWRSTAALVGYFVVLFSLAWGLLSGALDLPWAP